MRVRSPRSVWVTIRWIEMAYTARHSFDQTAAHPAKRERKGDGRKERKIEDPRQGRRVDPAVGERPGERHQVSQRQEVRRLLRPGWEVLDGEKGPAEQEHRRDEQEDRQVELLDGGDDRRAEKTGRAEG